MKPFTFCKHDDTFKKVKGINKERVICRRLTEYNNVGRIEYGNYFI